MSKKNELTFVDIFSKHDKQTEENPELIGIKSNKKRKWDQISSKEKYTFNENPRINIEDYFDLDSMNIKIKNPSQLVSLLEQNPDVTFKGFDKDSYKITNTIESVTELDLNINFNKDYISDKKIAFINQTNFDPLFNELFKYFGIGFKLNSRIKFELIQSFILNSFCPNSDYNLFPLDKNLIKKVKIKKNNQTISEQFSRMMILLVYLLKKFPGYSINDLIRLFKFIIEPEPIKKLKEELEEYLKEDSMKNDPNKIKLVQQNIFDFILNLIEINSYKNRIRLDFILNNRSDSSESLDQISVDQIMIEFNKKLSGLLGTLYPIDFIENPTLYLKKIIKLLEHQIKISDNFILEFNLYNSKNYLSGNILS